MTRQLLTESVLLALAGGALGLLVAWAATEVLLTAAPPGTIPRGQEVAIDPSSAMFTFALSAFVGLGAGLFPAFWSSRHSMRTWLSDGSSTPGARTRGRARAARRRPSRTRRDAPEPGRAPLQELCRDPFERSRVVADQTLVHAVDLPAYAYRDPERMLALHRRVLQGLAEIPGVVAAGAANLEPFGPFAVEARIRAFDS